LSSAWEKGSARDGKHIGATKVRRELTQDVALDLDIIVEEKDERILRVLKPGIARRPESLVRLLPECANK
jgi:hypothetical protein